MCEAAAPPPSEPTTKGLSGGWVFVIMYVPACRANMFSSCLLLIRCIMGIIISAFLFLQALRKQSARVWEMSPKIFRCRAVTVGPKLIEQPESTFIVKPAIEVIYCVLSDQNRLLIPPFCCDDPSVFTTKHGYVCGEGHKCTTHTSKIVLPYFSRLFPQTFTKNPNS